MNKLSSNSKLSPNSQVHEMERQLNEIKVVTACRRLQCTLWKCVRYMLPVWKYKAWRSDTVINGWQHHIYNE